MPGRARWKVLQAASAADSDKFLVENVAKGSTLETDGGGEFEHAREDEYDHRFEVTGKNWERARTQMARLNLLMANFKMWLRGTFHQSPHRRFLQLYLDEFCYRHNRRRTLSPLTPLQRLLEQACRLKAPKCRDFCTHKPIFT